MPMLAPASGHSRATVKRATEIMVTACHRSAGEPLIVGRASALACDRELSPQITPRGRRHISLGADRAGPWLEHKTKRFRAKVVVARLPACGQPVRGELAA